AHVAEAVARLERRRRDLHVQLGREPEAADLAADLGMTPEQVLELQRLARDPVSLDDPVGADGKATIGDLLVDSTAVVAADAAAGVLREAAIGAVLATRTEREERIIRLRFGLTGGRPHTLDEVSRTYGGTRERIRQIEVRTMTKLRHPARSRSLREYLT